MVALSSYHLPEITVLSSKRKENYLLHIKQLIEQVGEDIQSGKHEISTQNTQYPPLNMPCYDKEKRDVLNEMVCSECKGRCCLNGGDTAYLEVETIKRYITESPDLSLEDVLQSYSEVIAEKTHSSSCINHTESGCRLPKNMRSDMCNHFYCSTLKEFNMTFSKPEVVPDGIIIIARF